MSEEIKDIQPNSATAPAARLKKIGVIVLVSGFVIAALIYFIFPDTVPPDENSLDSQYYKQQEIDVQRLWGNQGSLILAFTRSLHHASTYSILIIIISIVVALACFYLATHPLGPEENPPRRVKD